MTVYEFIQELVNCNPNAEVIFDLGKLKGYGCSIKEKDFNFGDIKRHECHITIEE